MREMKGKIYLTILATVLWRGLAYFWSLYNSPIVGAANAQVLTDTTNAYVTSRAYSNGLCESILATLFVLSLALIWLRGSKQQPQ